MKAISVLRNSFNACKSYSSVILAVASGLGMILSKKYAAEFSDACQAMMIVLGGTSAVELRHAVAKSLSRSSTPE